ncbi:MAG: hypothetical protein MUF58_21975 [Arcicella sp.]|jgi:hypothetical protein|nr:hypothetical protein [Arcicella sp.]
MDKTLENCVLLLINSANSKLDGICGSYLKERLERWNFKFSDDELIEILEMYLEKDFIEIRNCAVDDLLLNNLYYITKRGLIFFDSLLNS